MPRAGLTHAILVAEAARQADEVGFERLSLAELARHFGVAVPSLYKHVRGLDEVRHEVAVRTLRELGVELAEASEGRSRGDALQALAHAYRAFAHAHPGRYPAILRAPHPDDPEAVVAAEALSETVFRALAGYGLTGDDAIDATRALRAAMHGYVSLEAAGGFGLPQDVDRSFERLVDGLHAALSSWR